MDKPAGYWLLFLPGAISIGMAGYAVPSLAIAKTTGLFFAGSIIMRGAGCTINDLRDRDIDRLVERTKDRPIAAGLISPREAISFLAVQLSAGLAILLQFNYYTIALGSLSLIPVALYPYMKRITNWPQAFLGLTFNWGALVGWSAITGFCYWPVVLPLYLSNILWTLMYDSIYALQDKKCDAKIGVKSSALSIHGSTKLYLSAFAAGQTLLLGLAGYMNAHGLPFYIVSVGGSALRSFWQIKTLREDDVRDCAKKFKSNVNLGLLILSGVYLDLLRKRYREKEEEAKEIQKVV